MNVYEAHSANGGIDGRLGCVGASFGPRAMMSWPSFMWLVIKYDVHNRDNVYIVPFSERSAYPAGHIFNPADEDHLVYGGYNGSRVFLMNRARWISVAEIGQCEVSQRDYPDARMLQKHLSDLVNNMVCEVKKDPPASGIRAELPEEDE